MITEKKGVLCVCVHVCMHACAFLPPPSPTSPSLHTHTITYHKTCACGSRKEASNETDNQGGFKKSSYAGLCQIVMV